MGSFSFPLTLCGRPEKSLNNMGRFDYGKATVSSWKDYEDGDQIQVVIDGTTYLVHSSNIVLMNE